MGAAYLFRRESLALWTGSEQNGSACVWFGMEYWSVGVMEYCNTVENDFFSKTTTVLCDPSYVF